MKFPFAKEAVKNLFSKPSTENFPKFDVPAKKGYRGRISYDPEKCTNCGACTASCKMDVLRVNDRECIRCGECKKRCHCGALT